MNLIVINLKKYLFTIIAILFVILLLIFSENNFLATITGMNLFITSVFPSLFPFLVATEILYNSNFINLFDNNPKKNSLVSKLFNVPSKSIIAIILGFISGYPIGAKITANLKRDKYLSKAEAERLISFTNNSSPIFIISTIGISILGNKTLGLSLLFIHIFSSILVGLIFRFWKYNDKESLDYSKYISLNDNNKLKTIPSNIDIFLNSIKNSVNTIFQIGGFVIIFSVILSILKSTGILNIVSYLLSLTGIPENVSQSLIFGFFEITNGLNLISTFSSQNLILSLLIISFLLGFGGISILFQIYSIIHKEHISIKPYLYGKLLHGIISVILACIIF